MSGDVGRRCRDAATRFARAASTLWYEAENAPNESVRWLAGYESEALLKKVLAEAWMLVDALNDDADAFGDVERDARALYESLRARRIAAKLANVEGRTPEEAAAFLAKAEELSPRAHVSERSPVRVPDEQEQP